MGYMAGKLKKEKFSEAYLRFQNQLVALHKGKLWQVKELAYQARKELERKTNLRQLHLYTN